MKIAVASGKGGTGKTTFAVNLALYLADKGVKTFYADCDVEEPNGHLFLKPNINDKRRINLPIPEVDNKLCTLCGKCGSICQFKAIAVLKTGIITFPELCHGCGACSYVCKDKAISEKMMGIGWLNIGYSGKIRFINAVMDIGVAKSPALIRKVRNACPDDNTAVVIIDSPPGTSCPVVTSIRGCDLSVLVTEPTPFGAHDLELAIQMTRELQVNCKVVINKSTDYDYIIEDLCRSYGIQIIGKIPDDRRIAEAYSRGITIYEALPDYLDVFREIWKNIERCRK